MYKTDIIEKVAKTTKIKVKDIDTIYNAIFDTIKNELYNGEEIVLTGFGTFKVNNRKERKGINPRNGDIIQISPKRVVTFRSSLSFKNYMSDKN